MAEIHGGLGPLFACHVYPTSRAPAPSGHAHPTLARLQLPRGRSWPTHGRLPIPLPAGLPGIHYLDPTAGSIRSP
jgi:hypothetical protein